jgi:hypothetical protein
VRLDGSPPRTLDTLRFYGFNYAFDVSSDASRLIVTNGQHFSDEIWLLEAAQGQKR